MWQPELTQIRARIHSDFVARIGTARVNQVRVYNDKISSLQVTSLEQTANVLCTYYCKSCRIKVATKTSAQLQLSARADPATALAGGAIDLRLRPVLEVSQDEIEGLHAVDLSAHSCPANSTAG